MRYTVTHLIHIQLYLYYPYVCIGLHTVWICYLDKKAPGSATSTSNLAPAMAEPEDGGFGNIEMTRQSRRQTRPFAGIRTGSASAKSSSIYAR